METLIINGGKALQGAVEINGAKNAAVAILPAAILASEGRCITVSYTHLDVYKRQTLYKAILDTIEKEFEIEFKDLNLLRDKYIVNKLYLIHI